MRNRYDSRILPTFRRFDDHGDPDGCWEWLGDTNVDGYGTVDKKRWGTAMAHRLFYMRYRGEIADGLEIDHLCRTRHCVNPDHLEVVTKAENARRGLNCKLVPEQVGFIKQWRRQGMSYGYIAWKIGISDAQVGKICKGLSWRGVRDPQA